MKDSSEFATLYLKPVLVDIGEEAPVPVLIPAENRVQTSADKLSSLQLDILRAVGMEMFTVSGIKSNQLDELLPACTKRASKYYSLNNLIGLGYITPHEKGDPYKITEAGRLKQSNAEDAIVSIKSNMSKASPSPFIWTLPESCPMSSPIPHTYGCRIDETLNNRATVLTTDIENLNDVIANPIPDPTQVAHSNVRSGLTRILLGTTLTRRQDIRC